MYPRKLVPVKGEDKEHLPYPVIN